MAYRLGKGLHLITRCTRRLKKTSEPELTQSHWIFNNLILYPSLLVMPPPTFLKAVPEGAWSAHGAGLLVKRHTRVPQPIVTARVKGDILIGQAVVAQTSEVDLSPWSWAGCCKSETGHYEIHISMYTHCIFLLSIQKSRIWNITRVVCLLYRAQILLSPTKLSEVEASARWGCKAGARGERGVTDGVLQATGGVGAQPITCLLVASQLRRWAIPAGCQRQGLGVRTDVKQKRCSV